MSEGASSKLFSKTDWVPVAVEGGTVRRYAQLRGSGRPESVGEIVLEPMAEGEKMLRQQQSRSGTLDVGAHR